MPSEDPKDGRIEVGPANHPTVVGHERVDASEIFAAAGAIPFEASANEIFDYVEEKAREIGLHVKKNRGMPGGAVTKNMLSPQEKAVVILGRAVGVSWQEILWRIKGDRIAAGVEPPDRNPGQYQGMVIERHKKIVAAIHTDMLNDVEAYSPLVGGSGRIIWRAKLLEFYRQRIFALGRNPRIKLEKKERRIAALDKAMERHMHYFDSLQKEGDIELLMGSLAERAQSQAQRKAEDEIAKRFANDEITDEERIDELRKLRHGELE